jgi:hypothetical protein
MNVLGALAGQTSMQARRLRSARASCVRVPPRGRRAQAAHTAAEFRAPARPGTDDALRCARTAALNRAAGTRTTYGAVSKGGSPPARIRPAGTRRAMALQKPQARRRPSRRDVRAKDAAVAGLPCLLGASQGGSCRRHTRPLPFGMFPVALLQ